MDRKVLVEFFKQVEEGWDIPAPEKMLKVAQGPANKRLDGMPYSLAENLWHAVYWQDLWLDQLEGKQIPSLMEVWNGDWQSPEPKEWGSLRSRFVAGLKQARDIAASEPFEHRMSSDEKAIGILVRIATHASYHCGQMNLLKRSSRAAGQR